MNEVEWIKFKGEFRKEIYAATRETIYDGLLKQALDDFKAAYFRNNAREVSSSEEATFLSQPYIRDSARRETDVIIRDLTDVLACLVSDYTASHKGGLMQKIFSGAAVLSGSYYLFSYAWAGYSYLNGAKDALDGITRADVINAIVIGTVFLILFIAACVRGWNKDS